MVRKCASDDLNRGEVIEVYLIILIHGMQISDIGEYSYFRLQTLSVTGRWVYKSESVGKVADIRRSKHHHAITGEIATRIGTCPSNTFFDVDITSIPWLFCPSLASRQCIKPTTADMLV